MRISDTELRKEAGPPAVQHPDSSVELIWRNIGRRAPFKLVKKRNKRLADDVGLLTSGLALESSKL